MGKAADKLVKNNSIRIRIIDGKTKRELEYLKWDKEASGSTETWCKDFIHISRLNIYNQQNDYMQCNMNVENNSDDELFYEIRLSATILPQNSIKYWDGNSIRHYKGKNLLAENATPAEHVDIELSDYLYPEIYSKYKASDTEFHRIMTKEFSGENQFFMFPASCIFSENEVLCIGIDPRKEFSYQSSGIDKDHGYYHSIKSVVMPGEKNFYPFIVFRRNSSEGERTALQTYYDIFPEVYKSSPRLDTAFMGAGATIRAFDFPGYSPFASEDLRRFGTKWTWNIVEARIGKMLFEMKEDYDKIPTAFPEMPDSDRKKINALIRKGNAIISENACPCYGLTFEHADIELVTQEDLLDSVWIRSDNSVYMRKKKNSYLMFANKTSFEDFIKKQLDKAVKKYNISGFIFDNAGGTRMYFGPAVYKCASRAFVNDKIYCSQGISHVAIMKHMNSLKKNKKQKYMLAANTPADYNLAREVDIGIIEGGPWLKNFSWTLGLRRLMGKKICVFWGPKGFPDWLNLSDKKIISEAESLVKQLLLFCFEYGFLPNTSHAVRGYPFMKKALPLLEQLAKAGWNPERKALLKKGNVSLERFGDDFYSIVNRSGRKKSVKFILPEKCSLLIPCMNGNIQLRNGQKQTEVEFDISAHSAMVLQKCGTWQSESAVLNIGSRDKNMIFQASASPFTLKFKKLLHSKVFHENEGRISVLPALASSTGKKHVLEGLFLDDKFDLTKKKHFSEILKLKKMPKVEVLTDGKTDMETAKFLRIYLAYYLASRFEEASEISERLAFEKGNHDTKFILRVCQKAREIYEQPCSNKKIRLITGTTKDNLKKLPKEIKYKISSEANTIKCFRRKKLSARENFENLIEVLDNIFDIEGVKSISERKYLKAKAMNLHIEI